MVLVVLLVLVVLVVLVVSHSILKEPSTIFFDFHQISNTFPNVPIIIFLSKSFDFLGLSSGSHTFREYSERRHALPRHSTHQAVRDLISVPSTPRHATPPRRQRQRKRQRHLNL
jgi:hypothetical protein